MKTNKKTFYIAIAFVCILVVSILVAIKNKGSASLVAADNESVSSSEVGSSTTGSTTNIPFECEETEKTSEKSVTEEKVTEVHTTTKPTTTRKDTSATKNEATTATTKVTTTTKPSKVHSTTEPPTETTTKKILYYYTDGTTGYTPKPGAEYYSNGCWNIVSWGNTVTDEEIKEAHKKCQYCGREDCIRFWISEQECPDCGVLVSVDVCHHCS